MVCFVYNFLFYGVIGKFKFDVNGKVVEVEFLFIEQIVGEYGYFYDILFLFFRMVGRENSCKGVVGKVGDEIVFVID